MRKNARLVATSATLLWAAAAPSRASAGEPPGGAVAVEATVLGRQSEWAKGLILTRTTLRIDRVMRGDAPPQIEVTELGGRVGDIAQFVPGQPAMPAGPRVALELMAMGKTWRLSSVLERVVSADTLAAGNYVRTTNKDSTPPCDGDIKEVYWPVAEVHYFLDDACSPDVDGNACEGAVRASFQTWQDVACAYLGFAYDGRVVDAPVGYLRDGPNLNVVKWIEADWPGPPSAQAVTLAAIGCTSGRVLDADILLNGELATFTTSPQPGEGRVDIQNTITHEAGHLAGFSHTPDPESTMFATASPDETLKRDLTADDAQGLCDVYPVGHEPGRDDGCGCATTAGREPNIVPTLAVALLITRLARRRRR